MTDEGDYDVFVDAAIEASRLNTRSKLDAAIAEERRVRDALVYSIEVGGRAALRSESMQRDERWWQGLFTRSYGSRLG